MASMAATLAASLPRPPLVPVAQPNQSNGPSTTKVPQRMEGVVDVEGTKEVESVNLNSLVSISRCLLPSADLTAGQKEV